MADDLLDVACEAAAQQLVGLVQNEDLGGRTGNKFYNPYLGAGPPPPGKYMREENGNNFFRQMLPVSLV